ncbi:MAG: sulfatase [Lentisphaerae bacterium]|jgi:arylsulfatase A-like enzyme|nr:sulfatase [Lentisphaerota bacterium]MBT4815309.1 sulfatase [Lentisphaerota bacterium]MBT5608161.1 sulfatase [Lentisphaerota bacterium]MBT7058709.1 sulfatase [Lentisphaerota bacterium]MBT7847661.1 sulfatase [Lentisphaerota bacterium]
MPVAPVPPDQRPNVLFVICDDLNNAVTNMGRVPSAPTPNLERIMSAGVRFPNAQCNSPICLPSRSSLFSGLYPHTTGHFTLWDHWRTSTPLATTGLYTHPNWGKTLLRDAVMMPRHFKDNGYAVYGVGKVLHEGVVDPSWWTDYGHGPDYGPMLWDRDANAQVGRPDREWLYDGEPFASYVRRYEGIDRFFLNGRRIAHHIEKCFGPLADVFTGEIDEAVDGRQQPFHYTDDSNRDLLPDEKSAAWAVDVLQRDHNTPFFLSVGFMKPHTPLNAPQEYFDRFPLDEIELPPQLKDDLADCARALIEHRPYGFLTYGLLLKRGEAVWREWLQAYLACVAFMDDQLGKILDALDGSPYRDNTIIVFTSDNGYHMGEKEYIFKDSLWEESCQVPLVISAPGVSARNGECRLPVSLIDVYPTLNDLCGLALEPHTGTSGIALEGKSLRTLLRTPAADAWEGPPVALTSVRGDTGVHHTVRSKTHRYTLCGNGEEELYDHRTDPHEWHNLARREDTESLAQELRAEMMKLLWP